jgi:hypothetical protein
MNNPGNVAEDGQQNVEPELASEANRQKYADRRQKDCE